MTMKLSRKAEDYLEAIFNVSQDKGHVRIRDICSELHIKPPTVVEMVKKLNTQGYLIHKKNDGVYLTEKGEEIGRVMSERHSTILAFLTIIGVPAEIADKDACVIEHELDVRTVGQIKSLVKFIESVPERPQWLDDFSAFCRAQDKASAGGASASRI
ncbi:MAG: manganese transport transcriptional regulator [Methanosaeta sp. PtaB.Bin039]|nr:MAG: manganese transport transcriptional regulator [Methanosaeta sp. PtaB.Bin039]HOT07388.1 metal-dependent transcriptional regulator [Methanotrichaceae archaeon]HQF15872.1 metal-dependent transcriptional regulator [Methanotrichaceae archaeon]HQI90452.1 metal-dependent transcriptional regulator [Methanotrichaceae archaeon]HQJ28159.1 metal-dependent transcriptional regulator [Methanotrichaceae archaeon]